MKQNEKNREVASEEKIIKSFKNLEIEDVIRKTDAIMAELPLNQIKTTTEEVNDNDNEMLIGSPMSISIYNYDSPREIIMEEEEITNHERNIFKNEEMTENLNKIENTVIKIN